MENTMIAKTQAYTFANKELSKATNMIIKATDTVGKSLFKIATVMAYVDERQLWADDFKNVVEYGERVFGYKKSFTYNLIKVGREYINNKTGNSVLINNEGEDYSFTQLVKMLPLPSADVAAELVDNGQFTTDMTAKQIEQVVREYNKKDEPETETEPETEEDPENEPVAVELNTTDVMFDTAKTAIDQLIEICSDKNLYLSDAIKALEKIKLDITAVEMMVNQYQ